MPSPAASAAQERLVPVTLALGLGTFLVLFDVTAVVVVTPVIVRDLGFAIAGAAWIIDTYSLAFAGALLASGALADRYGRRRAMLSGNAVFLIASIACGMATTGPMLLASRAVQGVGAAFMVTGAIALVAGAFPNQSQRTRAFGIIGVISGVAMALGPSLGGLLGGRGPAGAGYFTPMFPSALRWLSQCRDSLLRRTIPTGDLSTPLVLSC